MRSISPHTAAQFDIGQLPSIPRVLLRLVEACHRADVSFEELSGIIQQDAGLSARIIAVASSPAYGQRNEIGDFDRLLVMLGLKTIRTVAVVTAVHQFFSRYDPETSRWLGGFWYRSLYAACGARALARLIRYEAAGEAYLAGLLHRLGQLVFLSREPDRYRRALADCDDERQLEDRERELFGSSGAELGAGLADAWGLDPFLCDAIRYQREPAEAILDTPRLVRLVNFSHRLSEGALSPEAVFREADLLFGLSRPVVEELLSDIREEVLQVAGALGVELEDDNSFYADSEAVRLELARRVRQFALLGAVHQNMADSEELAQIMEAVLQDINLLFGLSSGICFLLDSGQMALRAVAGGRLPKMRLEELKIGLEPGRSLVAQALTDGRVYSSFDPDQGMRHAVIDDQLATFLSSDGLVCVPLQTAMGKIGVVVAGVDAGQWRELAGQVSMLNCFAEVAAGLVQRRLQVDQSWDQALQQERDRQQQQIRRLIHEANNPLAIINNYLQVMSLRLKQDPAVQKQLSILSEEIERVGNIILQMRDVSAATESSQGAVDINPLIEDLLAVFQVSHFSAQHIRTEISLDDSIPPILSNRNSLKQILTNLIRNSVEAMPEGGTIRIDTRDRVNLDGRQYVELRLSDDGPGLPPEVQANLFNPVPSSKGRGHAGLGLTIVRNLVAELGGSIGCRNRREGGVEFVILLPRKTVDPGDRRSCSA